MQSLTSSPASRFAIAALFAASAISQPRALNVAPGTWTQIGPYPLFGFNHLSRAFSGHVTDIAIDPSGQLDNTIYIATNGGGVWKSTDGGTNWVPKSDFMPSLSMGAVALDPSNSSIVYAGTGSFFNHRAGLDNRSAIGIYRSSDGGDTWPATLNPGGVFDGRGINRVVLPASNSIYVATDKGLYRSTNSGSTFTEIGLPANAATVTGAFINDLKLDPTDSTTVWVSAKGLGIFKIVNAGIPTSMLTPAQAGNVHFAQSTQPDHNTLYAVVEDGAQCKTLSFFKSVDAGAHWTSPPATKLLSNDPARPIFQCNEDDVVGVDPRNASRVYVGLIGMFRSTNGGMSFDEITKGPHPDVLHVDHHAMAFSPLTHSPANPAPIYVGTDGGMAVSSNGGENFLNINNGLATLEFRQIDIGRGNFFYNRFTYGGMQDNSVGVIGLLPPGWFLGLEYSLGPTDDNIGADGQGVAVDPSNPFNAYAGLNGSPTVLPTGE